MSPLSDFKKYRINKQFTNLVRLYNHRKRPIFSFKNLTICVCEYLYASVHVEVRRQIVVIGSLLPQCLVDPRNKIHITTL